MTISFYLRPTKDPETGVLAYCITDGGKVLQRRSYNLRINNRYWNKKNQRVEEQHADSKLINSIIQESTNVIQSFMKKKNDFPKIRIRS
jgi:hypothetical protein